MGSFQACLDRRAVFMLRSSTGCAVNTSQFERALKCVVSSEPIGGVL